MADAVFRRRRERARWIEVGDLVSVTPGTFREVAKVDTRSTLPDATEPDVVVLEFADKTPAVLGYLDWVTFLRPDVAP